MYKSDSDFESPGDDAKIWRYSDITKFMRVLQTHALYFASAERLTDGYEGTLTRPSLDRYIRMLADGSRISEQQARESVASVDDVVSRPSAAGMIGVNCWHLSEHESAAMWQVYSPRDSPGIVIQSTFDRLCRSFHCYKYNVWVGKMQYIDYTTEDIGNVRDVKQWFLHKRREFSYEKELRAMIIASWQPGKEVDCDLPVLIESIKIAPAAPPYLVELVSEICRLFKIPTDVTIMPSELTDPP